MSNGSGKGGERGGRTFVDASPTAPHCSITAPAAAPPLASAGRRSSHGALGIPSASKKAVRGRGYPKSEVRKFASGSVPNSIRMRVQVIGLLANDPPAGSPPAPSLPAKAAGT